jgi:hypothetical protein
VSDRFELFQTTVTFPVARTEIIMFNRYPRPRSALPCAAGPIRNIPARRR